MIVYQSAYNIQIKIQVKITVNFDIIDEYSIPTRVHNFMFIVIVA